MPRTDLHQLELGLGPGADAWTRWAESWVRIFVAHHGCVTPDDLQRACEADEMWPPSSAIHGVFWNRMRRLGLVRTVEEVTSKVASTNGRKVRVWRPGPEWGRAAS